MASKKIALLIHSLHGGGAERQMAMLATALAESGHSCHLITLDRKPASQLVENYPVSPLVQRHWLDVLGQSRGKIRAAIANIRRIGKIFFVFRSIKPELIISFTDSMNVLALMANRFPFVPIYICERSDPRKQSLGRFWEFWRRRLYPKATLCVSQTPSIAAYLRTITKGRPEAIIPSSIDPPKDLKAKREEYLVGRREDDRHYLLAFGRLSHEKGFDLLLDAWSRVCHQHPQWTLRIVGEGSEEASLHQRAQRLGIENRIQWIAWQRDIWSTLCESDAFVLPSRYEGFPQSLLQAMASSLPCIATLCSDAVKEVVEHDVNGWIVQQSDAVAIADGIDAVLGNKSRRIRLSENSAERVEPYNWSNLCLRWLNLCNSLDRV